MSAFTLKVYSLHQFFIPLSCLKTNNRERTYGLDVKFFTIYFIVMRYKRTNGVKGITRKTSLHATTSQRIEQKRIA